MKKLVWAGVLFSLLLMGSARNTIWQRHINADSTNVVIIPDTRIEVFTLFRLGGTDTVVVWFRRTSTDSLQFNVLPRADTTIPVIIQFAKDDPDIRNDHGIRVTKASGTILQILGSH